MKEILTEREQQELLKTLNNKPLLNGLKKTFLYSLYYGGIIEKDAPPEPRRNFICQLLYDPSMSMDYNIDNQRLGEKVRAVVEGIRAIESGFTQIETLKKPEVKDEEDVPAPHR